MTHDDDVYTEQRERLGLVACDNATCIAKDAPQTAEEWCVAAEHWRRHHYLHGCSHGR